MERWNRQLDCLDSIRNHAKQIRDHLARIQYAVNVLDKHGLPHPTEAEEEIRLTMALCASALEAIKTPPVVVPFKAAAE